MARIAVSADRPEEADPLVSAAQVLEPAQLVEDYLIEQKDFDRLDIERPRLPLVDDVVGYPPGWNATDWAIAFEGGYPWAIYFVSLEFEEGPVGDFCRKHRLHLECEAGWAISISSEDQVH